MKNEKSCCVRTSVAALPAGFLLLLSGCGSGSGSGTVPPVELGLDGDWKGLLDGLEAEAEAETVVLTIAADEIQRILINGYEIGEKGTIVKRAEGVFGFELDPVEDDDDGDGPDGLEDEAFGRLITSPEKDYMLVVSGAGDFGLLQKGEPAITDASLLDLNGTWSGSALGFLFGEEEDLYRYRVSGSCAIGTCVFTALEPATFADGGYVPFLDINNNVIFDITGFQATFTVTPRDRLLFDFTYTNTLGRSGSGRLSMSPDKRWVGTIACPTGSGIPEGCELALFARD